jgi:hypothetical protein
MFIAGTKSRIAKHTIDFPIANISSNATEKRHV